MRLTTTQVTNTSNDNVFFIKHNFSFLFLLGFPTFGYKKGTATSITAPNGYKQAITAGATILNSDYTKSRHILLRTVPCRVRSNRLVS